MFRRTSPLLPIAAALASLSRSIPCVAQSPTEGEGEREPPAQGVDSASQPLPPPPAPPGAAVLPGSYRTPFASPQDLGSGPVYLPAADDGPEPSAVMETRWYGWQTLLADAAALATASGGSEVSIGIYALGGPVVHWAHGNTWRGFGSLALRVGAPVVLGAAFSVNCGSTGDSESGMGCLGAAVAGVAVGMIGAIVVDAAVLARDTVPVDKDMAVRVGPVRVAPAIAAGPDRGSLLLQGTF